PTGRAVAARRRAPRLGRVPGRRPERPFTAQRSSGDGAPRVLIRGGTVIDPAEGLHAERDVSIAGGRVAAVAKRARRAGGEEVVDARGHDLLAAGARRSWTRGASSSRPASSISTSTSSPA